MYSGASRCTKNYSGLRRCYESDESGLLNIPNPNYYIASERIAYPSADESMTNERRWSWGENKCHWKLFWRFKILYMCKTCHYSNFEFDCHSCLEQEAFGNDTALQVVRDLVTTQIKFRQNWKNWKTVLSSALDSFDNSRFASLWKSPLRHQRSRTNHKAPVLKQQPRDNMAVCHYEHADDLLQTPRMRKCRTQSLKSASARVSLKALTAFRKKLVPMAVPFSKYKASRSCWIWEFSREVLRDQPNDVYANGSFTSTVYLQVKGESGYDPV